MKRALIYTSVASMIDQFNRDNIQILLDGGYEVHVAANFENGNSIDQKQVNQLKVDLDNMGVEWHHIPIPRNIISIKGIIEAYRKSDDIFSKNHFDLIHFHSPIGAAIGRLAALKTKKKGTRIIYTAHGFHFFKGSSVFSWLLFFPLEYILSYVTDTLITINSEDTKRALKMHAREVEYIPGVGIDVDELNKAKTLSANTFRDSIGINQNEIILLSIGELNPNKNHKEVIKVLKKLKKPIYYIICGQGEELNNLSVLAEQEGVRDYVHFLGYRTDIPSILSVSDIFCLPSKREGLSVGLMEAMSASLPCVVSKIRGNTDLIDAEGGYLFNLGNEEELITGLDKLISSKEERELKGKYNQSKMKKFDISVVNNRMKEIYLKNARN